MDKQFINIDDLVRHRLSGGEEEERAGAWLNMRNLLDKEMPQKKRRGGFFFWFNSLAVIGVISAISFGGYELTSFIERSNAQSLSSTAYPVDKNVIASAIPGDFSMSNNMHSSVRTSDHSYSSSSADNESNDKAKTSRYSAKHEKNALNGIVAKTENTSNITHTEADNNKASQYATDANTRTNLREPSLSISAQQTP
jgi:hypothetical protein